MMPPDAPAPMPGPMLMMGGPAPAPPPDMAAMVQAMAGPPPPPQTLHDVTVVRNKKYGCAKVYNIPPEEFGISPRARNVADSTYCFHEVQRPEFELIAEGFDPDQVKELPTYGMPATGEAQARDTVDESNILHSEALNRSARLIAITEHYARLDYEGDGVARLYKVTTATDSGAILRRKKKSKDGKKETYQDDIEPVDVMPFAAMTPVIMTHRFFGRSIADLVMDIQKIKTALLRGLLDNVYGSNMPRPVINEAGVGDTTIDDILTWRHGAPIRTKLPGAIEWAQIPPIANQLLPVIEYWDAIREWRTGVTRQGQGIDANSLQNQSATAVNQAFTAAQARMKLIARIFAETGIRDMFLLLHQVIRKHGGKAETVRLRNEWVQVDPRQWKTRTDMTINVGLGTGGKQQQLANFMLLLQAQEKAAAQPALGLVQPGDLYESAKEFTKLLGYKNGAERFFTDPTDPSSPKVPPPPDPKMVEAQNKMQIEQQKAQADLQLSQQKAQSDLATNAQRMQMEFQLKRQQMAAELQLKREEMLAELQLKREEVALKARYGAFSAPAASGISPVHPGGEVG